MIPSKGGPPPVREDGDVRDSFNSPAAKTLKRIRKEKEEAVQVQQQPKPDRLITVPKRGQYASVEGQVSKITGSDFISDDEEVMFQQDAITESIRQQAKIAQDRARLVGKPISYEEAVQRVRITDTGLRVNPATGTTVSPNDPYSKRPMTEAQVEELAVRRFPFMTMQAKASGLTREEQSAVVSLPLAIDAVKRIMGTQNPSRQQQILNTMGPDMQALMMDVYELWRKEADEKIEVRADSTESSNVVTKLIGLAWDNAIGPIFDGLIFAGQQTIRSASTLAYMSSGATMEDAWDASQPGSYDPEMIEAARKKYGEMTVDVILDAFKAKDSEDPNVGIATLWKKYATEGDLDRLGVLEQALSLNAYDKNTLDAITYLASSDTGKIGNLFNWSLGALTGVDPTGEEGFEYPQTALFTGTRDAVNLISIFAFDPGLGAGRFANIYRLQKYGFSKLSTQTIDETFRQKGVSNFFDTLGAGLAKANQAEDAAQSAQVLNSLRSQYKRWLTPDAIEAFRKAKIYNAEDASNFFKDARNIELMVSGQSAKRAGQITIPHMVTASALVKRSSLVARGLTYDRGAAKNIDAIFGEGVAKMLPEEAIPIIINRLTSSDGDKFVGRMLSDFVFSGAEAKRTFVGKILGTFTSNAKEYERVRYAMNRYGFKRDGGPRARVERVSRLMAHMPNVSRGIHIDDGRDAVKIRDLMLYAGMPKYWADYSSSLWKTMNPGQRKQFAGGIGRSVGYSLGVDIVDPVNGTKLIDNMVSGMRSGEMYAPNFVDMTAVRAGVARQQASETESLISRTHPNMTFYKDGGMGGVGEKSGVVGPVKTSFLRDFPGNKTDPERVAFFKKELSEGRGFENPLIVEFDPSNGRFFVGEGNHRLQAAIEVGEEYVPVRVIRARISDGRIKNIESSSQGGRVGNLEVPASPWKDNFKEDYWPTDIHPSFLFKENKEELGDAASKAPISNPSMLPDGSSAALYQYQMTDVISFPNMAALERLSIRQSYLTALLGNNKNMSTITDVWTLGTIAGPRFFLRNGMEDAGLYAITGGSWNNFRYGQLHSRAKREAIERVNVKPGDKSRGQKLGLAVTASRHLGDTLPKALNTLILPHIDEAERLAAKTMAANGDREGLVLLIRKAFLRQKFLFINRPKNATTIRYLDEGAEHPLFFGVQDEVSESTETLASGAAVGSSTNDLNRAILNGEIQDIRGIVLPYRSMDVSPDNPASIKGWFNNINAVVHADGVFGPGALRRLKKYHAAKLSGNPASIERVVRDYTYFIEREATSAMRNSAIYATEGAGSMARRKLDDALRIFTTKDGSFNDDLFDAVKKSEVRDGKTVEGFAMHEMVDGKLVPRLTEEMLVNMPGKPMSALGVDNSVFPVAKQLPLTSRTWAAMGRSLARFTREPIFIANYLDSRAFLEPIQRALAKQYGDVYATKWAVESAYERSYKLSMSYVDDPNIRSQMAWSVRNVARFYRAQEDFFRRMMRTGRNNPAAIQRLNLSWHALDETGFTQIDENGDKYFVWPGNKVTLGAINWFTSSFFDKNVLEGGALVDFTSEVTMLTPSGDPDALPPTLSGPYASIGFPVLVGLVPALAGLQGEIMGEYSVGRTLGWENAIPSNAMKAFDLTRSLLKQDDMEDNDTVFADSARSAMQVYMATGLVDETKEYTATELSKIKDDINVLGVDIAMIKSISGPVMPAAMSINPQTVTSFAKSMGVSGMRKIFIELLKLNDGDFNATLVQWVAKNPGLSVFSVSENDNPDSFGYFAATKETQLFIETNKELLDNSKIGGAFFAPQEGVQSLSAWKYLAAMGAKIPKSVNAYFNELVTAEGYARYKIFENQYYTRTDAANMIPDEDTRRKSKSSLDTQFTNAKKQLYIDFPNLSSRISGALSTNTRSAPSDHMKDIADISYAISWMEENRTLDDRGLDAKEVIELYNQALTSMRGVNPADSSYKDNRDKVRDQWKAVYASYSERYLEDTQWRLLMSATSGALGFEVG